jgi:hypothetical protein
MLAGAIWEASVVLTSAASAVLTSAASAVLTSAASAVLTSAASAVLTWEALAMLVWEHSAGSALRTSEVWARIMSEAESEPDASQAVILATSAMPVTVTVIGLTTVVPILVTTSIATSATRPVTTTATTAPTTAFSDDGGVRYVQTRHGRQRLMSVKRGTNRVAVIVARETVAVVPLET